MAVLSPPTPVATSLGTPCNTSPRDIHPLPFLNCHLTSDTTHGTARTSPLDPHTYDLIRLPTAPSTPLSTTGPSTPIRLVSRPVSNASSPTPALPALPTPPALSNAATPTLMHPIISNLPKEESESLGLSGMAKSCKTIAPVLWASPSLAPVVGKVDVVDRRLLKPRELEAEDSPVDDGTGYIRLPEVDDADTNADSDTEPELLAKRATSEGTDALWADAEQYMKRMRLDSPDVDDMSV